MLDRDAIDRIMAGVPRLERAPGVGLRVVAASPTIRSPDAHRADGGWRASPRMDGGGGGRDAYRLRLVFDRIDHVGVAVEELDASLRLYRDLFTLDVAHREVVQEQGVEAALLDVGENHVELLAPLGPDTPIGKFLASRAPACTTSPIR